MGDEDEYSGPLTKNELMTFRRMARSYEHAKWLKKLLKQGVTWILGAPIAIWGTWSAVQSIIDLIKRKIS